jgi:hypothetical protein
MMAPTEVEPGDPPIAKRAGRPRWTIGRFVTDLAIIMVAVPLAVDFLAPRPKGSCATDEWTGSLLLGMILLGLRAAWPILFGLNHATERWLDRREVMRSLRKPQPPDDL